MDTIDFFFFQAEDGIRDLTVTGVQTCALPISNGPLLSPNQTFISVASGHNEVGFIGGIVRVRFAFDLDVSFDGSALGVVQPDFSRPSFVIAGFTEEGPVTIPTPVKVFRFEPARAFVRVSSSCPLPPTREEGVIDASERAFAHHVPMIVRPTANLWVELIDPIGGRHPMRG